MGTTSNELGASGFSCLEIPPQRKVRPAAESHAAISFCHYHWNFPCPPYIESGGVLHTTYSLWNPWTIPVPAQLQPWVSECLSSRFTHIVFLFSGLSFISNWSYSLLPKPRLIPALGYFFSKPLPPSDLRLLPRGPNPIAITDRSRTYVRTTTARSSYTRSLSLHRSSSSLSLSPSQHWI